MTTPLSISLLPHLPAPPAESEARGNWLHWLVMIMNPAANMGFIASPLHAAAPPLSPHKAIGLRPWQAGDNTKEGA